MIAGDQGKEVEKPKLDSAAVFSPKEKPSKPAFTGFGLSNKDEKTDEKEEPAFKGAVVCLEIALVVVLKCTFLVFKGTINSIIKAILQIQRYFF